MQFNNLNVPLHNAFTQIQGAAVQGIVDSRLYNIQPVVEEADEENKNAIRAAYNELGDDRAKEDFRLDVIKYAYVFSLSTSYDFTKPGPFAAGFTAFQTSIKESNLSTNWVDYVEEFHDEFVNDFGNPASPLHVNPKIQGNRILWSLFPADDSKNWFMKKDVIMIQKICNGQKATTQAGTVVTMTGTMPEGFSLVPLTSIARMLRGSDFTNQADAKLAVARKGLLQSLNEILNLKYTFQDNVESLLAFEKMHKMKINKFFSESAAASKFSSTRNFTQFTQAIANASLQQLITNNQVQVPGEGEQPLHAQLLMH